MKPSMNVRDVRRVRLGVASVAAIGLLIALPGNAQAAATPIPLGNADPFVVLAGQTITNTGTTTINGDIGISPGSSLTGGPPLMVLHGTSHVADPVALGAQAALGTAFDNAAGQTPATAIPSELGGSTLVPGIYSSGVFTITNTLTLDAGNNPNAVFVFQSAATLNAAAGSRVNLINGASPCNVFWLVRSSATLETTANFSGNILALTDVHLRTGATVQGRALARNGEITLDANTITRPACGATPTPPVIAAPGAPTGVTVTPGNGQAVVSWTPSVSGGAATSFTVTASPGGMSVTTTGTTATVTGLTNGTSYTFTVTATNSAGTAVSVASAAAIPAAGVVPVGAPATGDGSTSGGANDGLGLLAGVLVFAGVGGVTVVATRRRRRLT
jgi:hypothetical protein